MSDLKTSQAGDPKCDRYVPACRKAKVERRYRRHGTGCWHAVRGDHPCRNDDHNLCLGTYLPQPDEALQVRRTPFVPRPCCAAIVGHRYPTRRKPRQDIRLLQAAAVKQPPHSASHRGINQRSPKQAGPQCATEEKPRRFRRCHGRMVIFHRGDRFQKYVRQRGAQRQPMRTSQQSSALDRTGCLPVWSPKPRFVPNVFQVSICCSVSTICSSFAS